MLKESEVQIIGRLADVLSEVEIPSFDAEMCAGTGFPSPAVDYSEHPIDLNKELIRDRDSTFVGRVKGDSMIDACVLPGSHLIIDKSIVPDRRKKDEKPFMVVAVVEEKFAVKFYCPKDGNIWLFPANKHYKPLLIDESHNFYIWGVVTRIIIDTRMKNLFTPSWTEITSIAAVKGYSSQDWSTNPW